MTNSTTTGAQSGNRHIIGGRYEAHYHYHAPSPKPEGSATTRDYGGMVVLGAFAALAIVALVSPEPAAVPVAQPVRHGPLHGLPFGQVAIGVFGCVVAALGIFGVFLYRFARAEHRRAAAAAKAEAQRLEALEAERVARLIRADLSRGFIAPPKQVAFDMQRVEDVEFITLPRDETCAR